MLPFSNNSIARAVAISLVVGRAYAQVIGANLECLSGNNINNDDSQNLINFVNANNLNPPEPDPNFVRLDHRKSHQYSFGNAQICVVNDFVFENTHYKLTDVAAGAQQVHDVCSVAGGTIRIRGDSGLLLDVIIVEKGATCIGILG